MFSSSLSFNKIFSHLPLPQTYVFPKAPNGSCCTLGITNIVRPPACTRYLPIFPKTQHFPNPLINNTPSRNQLTFTLALIALSDLYRSSLMRTLLPCAADVSFMLLHHDSPSTRWISFQIPGKVNFDYNKSGPNENFGLSKTPFGIDHFW